MVFPFHPPQFRLKPSLGVPVVWQLVARKNKVPELTDGENRVIPRSLQTCDGRTDGQTDGQATCSTAECDKNGGRSGSTNILHAQ